MRQVLYEAKLSKVGHKLACGALVLIALLTAVGMVLCFEISSFLDSLLPLGVLVFVAVGFSIHAMRMMRLSKNAGFYRISIDDYGLYVQSDDSSLASSFSVIAPDMCRLVRKTITQYDRSDDHEYYVETKSGTRHRIVQLFADYDLDVMALFSRIIERFPWVEILEEVKQ